MTTKHTPGPWNKTHFINHTVASIRTESGITVATAFGYDLEHTKANADLIAAAPELLAALEAIIGNSPEDKYGYFAAHNAMDDKKRNSARAAIAKARGEA